MGPIALSVILAGLTVWITTLKFGFVLPIGLIVLAYVYWSFQRPVVAVCTIIILYLHIIERSEDVTAVEIAFGLYLYGYLTFWFTNKILFRAERILTTRIDLYLVGFLLIGGGSIILILMNNASLLYWFREFVTLSALLLYFPLRDVLKIEKERKAVLVTALIMILIVAIYNVFEYKTSTFVATYLWELVGGRQSFGSYYFVALSLAAISVFIHTRRVVSRIVFAPIILLSVFALALTFSRGFWMGLLLGLVVLYAMSGGREKRSLLLIAMVAGIVIMVVATLYLGRMSGFVLEALLNRFQSTGSGLADLSVAERFAESRDILKAVWTNPLLGYGIGSKFTHFNIIDRVTVQTLYAHNSYLFLLFKVGILGFLFFFGFFISVLWRAAKLSRSVGSKVVHVAISRAIVAFLVALLLIGTNSGILADKQCLFLLALSAAYVAARTENTFVSLTGSQETWV